MGTVDSRPPLPGEAIRREERKKKGPATEEDKAKEELALIQLPRKDIMAKKPKDKASGTRLRTRPSFSSLERGKWSKAGAGWRTFSSCMCTACNWDASRSTTP